MSLLDQIDSARPDFVWKDGERLIAFGRASLASLPAFLRAADMEQYALLGTERSLEQFSSIAIGGEEIASRAAARVIVGQGGVPELAAEAMTQLGGMPIIAVGGGRVVDTAKAAAAATGTRVAAIPTSLSGAPMTSAHRLAAGHSGPARPVRPTIVIAHPDLMASQPDALRVGSAMNALSHAVESLFVAGGSAVPRLAGARAVKLLYRPLADRDLDEETRRLRLALGAVQAGYAVGATGFAIHHVICQTVVRVGEVAHAPTYGVLLPYTLEFYKLRDDLTWSLVSAEMDERDPSTAIARLCAEAGNPTSLQQLGLAPERIDQVVGEAAMRAELALVPGGADVTDIMSLIDAAA